MKKISKKIFTGFSLAGSIIGAPLAIISMKQNVSNVNVYDKYFIYNNNKLTIKDAYKNLKNIRFFIYSDITRYNEFVESADMSKGKTSILLVKYDDKEKIKSGILYKYDKLKNSYSKVDISKLNKSSTFTTKHNIIVSRNKLMINNWYYNASDMTEIPDSDYGLFKAWSVIHLKNYRNNTKTKDTLFNNKTVISNQFDYKSMLDKKYDLPKDMIIAPYFDIAFESTYNTELISKNLDHMFFGFLNGNSDPAYIAKGELGQWGHLAKSDKDKKIDGRLNLAEKFYTKGKKITIAIGGAFGNTPATVATSSKQLYEYYKKIIDIYHVNNLDFDLENNSQFGNQISIRRHEALKMLKANPKYSHVKIIWTLASLPRNKYSGGSIGGHGITLESILDAGAPIDIVNAMTMDPGTAYWDSKYIWHEGDPVTSYVSSSDMAINIAISAAKILHEHNRFNNLSIKEIYKMIGITVMTGRNDNSSEYTMPHDMRKIAKFASMPEHQLGMLGFWSVTRDSQYSDQTSSVSANHSSIKSQPFEFYYSYAKYKSMKEHKNQTAIDLKLDKYYIEMPISLLSDKALHYDNRLEESMDDYVKYEEIK